MMLLPREGPRSVLTRARRRRSNVPSSCPMGQAPGELLQRDKQQSPLLAKPPRAVPELLPALPRSWWGPRFAHIWEQQYEGSQPCLPWRGAGFLPGAAASRLGAWSVRRGGCPGSGVPKGIGFPAHLRPDILSASPAPALVCRSQPGLKFH